MQQGDREVGRFGVCRARANLGWIKPRCGIVLGCFAPPPAAVIPKAYTNPPIFEAPPLEEAPLEEATQLGWQTPPAARIQVALSGTRDADWALEEDERAF